MSAPISGNDAEASATAGNTLSRFSSNANNANSSYQQTKTANMSAKSNSPSRKQHRPPAKKVMGSVFRYLTDVEGSALNDIVSGADVARAQSAPDGPLASIGGRGNLSPRRSPRGGAGLNVGKGSNGAGNSTAGKMRALDDYFNHFPIDRPSSAAPLVIKNSNEQETFVPTKGHRQATLDQEIKKYEQEAHTRKVGKEAATKTFNNLRKKQNFEGWLAVSERNNRKMRRENDALAKLAQIAQENCIDNDAKYEEVLSDLRTNVELASVVRRNDDPNLQLMQSQFDVIERRIEDICETAKEQVSAEFSNLKTAFERQVVKQNEKLEAVRESGKTTTEQWRQRNNEVQEGLLSVLQRLLDADEDKKVLQKELQKLRVSYGAQDNDGPLLEKEFRKVTRKHQQLKERMQYLEVQVSQKHAAKYAEGAEGEMSGDTINATTRELIQTSGQVGATLMSRDAYQRRRAESTTNAAAGAATASNAASAPLPPPSSSHQLHPSRQALSTSAQMLTETERRQREYAQTLQNAEDLLETEAHNLRSIRQAHAAALKQRTELEVFLLQSILYHRQWKEHKIKEGSLAKPHKAVVDENNTQTAELIFDAEDRRKVIERLLSRDRVIKLLYGALNGGADEGASAAAAVGEGGAVSSSMPTTTRSSRSNTAVDDGGGLAEGGGNNFARSSQAMTPAVAAQNSTLDRGEVGQLWEKWKRWTKNAQLSLDKQYASEQARE